MRKNTLNDLAKIAKQAADEYPAFERRLLNELNSRETKLHHVNLGGADLIKSKIGKAMLRQGRQ
ncbi:MAG: hypothetical protein MN733_15910 [Nitrososphaera sp.]|nr:hypothetical protein [Nitrososphaera sp.]